MSSSRYRNLLIIIGVLLLTNIAVLVYFLGPKKESKVEAADAKKEPQTVTEMLQQDVGFTEQQIAQYRQMKDKQKQVIRPMYDDMRKTKDSLFRLLSYPETSDTVLNKWADAIAHKQKTLDLQTFDYFKRVRILCTSAQLPKYDSMILPMLRKLGKNPKHSEPPKPAEKK